MAAVLLALVLLVLVLTVLILRLVVLLFLFLGVVAFRAVIGFAGIRCIGFVVRLGIRSVGLAFGPAGLRRAAIVVGRVV